MRFQTNSTCCNALNRTRIRCNRIESLKMMKHVFCYLVPSSWDLRSTWPSGHGRIFENCNKCQQPPAEPRPTILLILVPTVCAQVSSQIDRLNRQAHRKVNYVLNSSYIRCIWITNAVKQFWRIPSSKFPRIGSDKRGHFQKNDFSD
jgi:hypothetical protein